MPNRVHYHVGLLSNQNIYTMSVLVIAGTTIITLTLISAT